MLFCVPIFFTHSWTCPLSILCPPKKKGCPFSLCLFWKKTKFLKTRISRDIVFLRFVRMYYLRRARKTDHASQDHHCLSATSTRFSCVAKEVLPRKAQFSFRSGKCWCLHKYYQTSSEHRIIKVDTGIKIESESILISCNFESSLWSISIFI